MIFVSSCHFVSTPCPSNSSKTVVYIRPDDSDGIFPPTTPRPTPTTPRLPPPRQPPPLPSLRVVSPRRRLTLAAPDLRAPLPARPGRVQHVDPARVQGRLVHGQRVRPVRPVRSRRVRAEGVAAHQVGHQGGAGGLGGERGGHGRGGAV